MSFNILYVYYAEYTKMKKNMLKSILYILGKCALYLIVVALAVVVFIQVIYFYEGKKFIDNCVEEGNTLEKCRNIWAEIDALN